jgi:hypothetical protein
MGDDALRVSQSPTLPEETETHYTLQEAAEHLGVDVAELHLAVKSKTLTCTHHYGRSLVSRDELELYRQRTQPSVDTAENAADARGHSPAV